MNPTNRRKLAALVSAAFAIFWAALQWPWLLHQERNWADQFGPWLFAGYFALLSIALIGIPNTGRWLALVSGTLLLSFLLLVALAAVGVGSTFCSASDWRCYGEPIAVSLTGGVLVFACFRPLQERAAKSEA